MSGLRVPAAALLQCPVSGRPLAYGAGTPRHPGAEVGRLADSLARVLPGGADPHWVGTEDGVRFPVLGDIPLLLADYAHDGAGPLGLCSAAATEEMEFYNRVSFAEAADLDTSTAWQTLRPTLARPDGFPTDVPTWIDAPYDGPAQLRCYAGLADLLSGGTLAQVGGTGSHAVKFLVAGARQAVVVAPMLGEVAVAAACALRAGVADRLVGVVGVGESLPLAAATVDGIFCGGTLHHMDTAVAGRELGRVLRTGGRICCAEPWKVPVLHAAGTRAFGKREAVHCRPIDPGRLADFTAAFPGQVQPRRHGGLSRYPMLALGKLGVRPRTERLVRATLLEDAVAGPFRGLGGSISLVAERDSSPAPVSAASSADPSVVSPADPGAASSGPPVPLPLPARAV